MHFMNKALFFTTLAVICVITFSKEKSYKKEAVDFMHCVACAKSDEPRFEYMRCVLEKPQKVLNISAYCMIDLLPVATSINDLWPRLCSKKYVAGKLYDCFDTEYKKIKLTNQEHFQMSKYVACCAEVSRAFCGISKLPYMGGMEDKY